MDPGNLSVLVRPKIMLLVLLTGVLCWRIDIARKDMTISNLYLTKEVCKYRSSKDAVIFLDERAQATLTSLNIKSEDILNEANRLFAEQNLPIRYSTDALKLRSWNTQTGDCKFFDNKFMNEKRCFLNEMAPKAKQMRKEYAPDLLIFMTATGIDYMSGRSLTTFSRGNGTIILNLGLPQKRFDSDKNLKRVARKFFIRRFAQLVMHEHAHLYGAVHSQNQRSIMHENLSDLGSHRVKFDEDSRRRILLRHIAILDEMRKTCAAIK